MPPEIGWLCPTEHRSVGHAGTELLPYEAGTSAQPHADAPRPDSTYESGSHPPLPSVDGHDTGITDPVTRWKGTTDGWEAVLDGPVGHTRPGRDCGNGR